MKILSHNFFGISLSIESVPISQSEELLITTLATLNNLSFYSQDENTILIYQEKIALSTNGLMERDGVIDGWISNK